MSHHYCWALRYSFIRIEACNLFKRNRSNQIGIVNQICLHSHSLLLGWSAFICFECLCDSSRVRPPHSAYSLRKFWQRIVKPHLHASLPLRWKKWEADLSLQKKICCFRSRRLNDYHLCRFEDSISRARYRHQFLWHSTLAHNEFICNRWSVSDSAFVISPLGFRYVVL